MLAPLTLAKQQLILLEVQVLVFGPFCAQFAGLPGLGRRKWPLFAKSPPRSTISDGDGGDRPLRARPCQPRM